MPRLQVRRLLFTGNNHSCWTPYRDRTQTLKSLTIETMSVLLWNIAHGRSLCHLVVYWMMIIIVSCRNIIDGHFVLLSIPYMTPLFIMWRISVAGHMFTMRHKTTPGYIALRRNVVRA